MRALGALYGLAENGAVASGLAAGVNPRTAVGQKADGTLVFASDLPIGSYYVKEYAVDAQYLISEETYPITFTYEDDTTAVVRIEVNNGEAILNRIIRGSITGIKVDEQGEPLPGAVFGLFRADCTDFTMENALLTAESAEDGSFSFENIPYGVWLVREIATSEGYVLSDEIFTVQVSENGAVIELGNLENKPITGELELTKKDISDGKLLPGAGFRIKDADGNVVAEGYTDENGIAKFTLRYGKYTYEEFDAPEGYRIDTTPHEFEITEDGQIVKAEMTNEKIPTPDVPQTGDESNLGFWIGLGSIALGGAIACGIVGLGCDLTHQLCAHVLELVLQLDLLCDGHAIVSDNRCAELFAQHHIAALGAQGDLNGVCQGIDTGTQCLAGFLALLDLLSHILSLLRKCLIIQCEGKTLTPRWPGCRPDARWCTLRRPP